MTAGEGYGPIWQAVLAANWSPTILASAGAWYNGFSAMGPLQAKASAYYYNCADTATQTFIGHPAVRSWPPTPRPRSNRGDNYLTFMATDSMPAGVVELRHHQVPLGRPAAIKKAIEGIHNQ